MRICSALAALLLVVPSVGATAHAQLAPDPDAPPVSNAPAQPDTDKSVATFKTSTNLVDLFFTVRDKNGELVPHLTQSDCTVQENKVPQTLKTFTAITDQPLTLGILLDTSGSQYRLLPMEEDAGSQFLNRVMRTKDEAFLVSFDVNVDLLQDYTNNPHLLARAFKKAQINDAGGNGAGGIPGLGGGPVPTVGDPKGTLLYDAIYLASTEKMAQQADRKALIILTDGQDEGSKTKISQAIAAAQKNDVIIYFILVADKQLYWDEGMWYTGYSAAKKIADETGGRVIDVGNNGPKLQAAFEQIEDELRTQYLASYVSTDNKLDGTFRHISVSCGEGTKVQVRHGYFAMAPDGEGQ